jgi:hypothetical protein
MKYDGQTYRISEASNIGHRLFYAGIGALLISAIGIFVDGRQFFYSYLVAFAFWVSVGLGALFFTMVHHLTGANWSVVVRRLRESLMGALPVLFVLFIPLAFGLGHLYEWAQPDKVAADVLLQKKAGYLNNWFFLVRTLIYFAGWFVLVYLLTRVSLLQDKAHSEVLTARMKKISGAGVVLFGFTLTFAAWDWLMSLEAQWYSTIYGVYYFAGAAISSLAAVILIAVYLRGKQALVKEITPEHYHDLAKLLFAFVVFWGYMAFSQSLLIWYANIPEETIWFQHRWAGSWKTITLLLLFGHFVVPFIVLIIRAPKRHPGALKYLALWLLLMHWMDIYWLAMPSLHKEGFRLSWLDLTTFVGIGGVYLGLVWKRLCSEPLLPVNDPKLTDSLEFVNQ